MLFPEIPQQERGKLAIELKFDLKIFSMTLKNDNKADDNIYAKCDVLCKYLERKEDIGNIDYPGPFFKGTLPLVYGIYRDYASDLTFFSGETEDTFLILIGSSDNIVSSNKDFTAKEKHSPDYYTMKFLNYTIENPTVENELYSDKRVLKELYNSAKYLVGIRQNLAFIAKKLFQGQIEGKKKVLLATPIYVALEE